MKNITLKILLITTILISTMQICSMAAVIVSSDKQVESNSGTVTVSVNSNKALGAYKLTLTDTAGLTLVSASSDGQVSSDKKTITGSSDKGITTLGSFTFTVPSVTKDTKYNVKFSITGMETPNLEEISNENNTAVITVKAKAVEQPKTEKPAATTEKPTTTETPKTTVEPKQEQPKTTEEPKKQEEPNFTEANTTMYASKNINLRSSWSTSSTATYIKKGTELKVTATSTNKVNDYVWYRVSYNGQTKYVASYLLTSTKPEEEKKSDNNNLKLLSVGENELIPAFSANVTSYTVQVAKDTKRLEIKAEPEDEKASVSIKGNEDLKEGENTVTISVSSENGDVKIYEIKVEKLPEKLALGLQTLKIKGTNIATKFKPDTYNYEIDIEDASTKLDIEAVANDEKATVEILGNEDLKEGENVITIIVSSEDEKEKVTYQIKANKKEKLVATTSAVTTGKKEANTKMYLYAGIGVLVVIALIIVIAYVIKHRNQEEYDDEEFEGVPEELAERKGEPRKIQEWKRIENTQEIGTIKEESKEAEDEQNVEELRPRTEDNLENEERIKRKGKHF